MLCFFASAQLLKAAWLLPLWLPVRAKKTAPSHVYGAAASLVALPPLFFCRLAQWLFLWLVTVFASLGRPSEQPHGRQHFCVGGIKVCCRPISWLLRRGVGAAPHSPPSAPTPQQHSASDLSLVSTVSYARRFQRYDC